MCFQSFPATRQHFPWPPPPPHPPYSPLSAAGTNNVPVARMPELGIPVFNTPGANANAVKELVICGAPFSNECFLIGGGHNSGAGGRSDREGRVSIPRCIDAPRQTFRNQSANRLAFLRSPRAQIFQCSNQSLKVVCVITQF